MPLGEFELIDRYLQRRCSRSAQPRARVSCWASATMRRCWHCRRAVQLVAALDTLVEGRAFPGAAVRAASIGHRALAVNLSDLAAMGAEPAWFLLSLTMPKVDEAWLEALSQGMHALARRAPHCAGRRRHDARSTLAVRAGAGSCARLETHCTRAGARPGDLLFVSGHVGDAAAGLALELAGAGVESQDTPAQAQLRAALPAIRRRESRWAARCAASPVPASMSRTDSPPMPASSPMPAAAVRTSTWSACRCPTRCGQPASRSARCAMR